MKITESHLRRLIHSILLEAEELPPPDEPRVAPDEALGQYAMPRLTRNDRRYDNVPEKNTELESRLQSALVKHYDSADSTKLRAIWDDVYSLAAAGMYPNLLVPPNGPVYRIMETDPSRAARILGITEEEMTSQTNIVQVAPAPPPFMGKEFISSWTSAPRGIGINAFLRGHFNKVSLILIAQCPGSGQFIMNPQGFARDFNLGSMYKTESEVIAGGPIQVVSAAWMWHGVGLGGQSSGKSPIAILNALLSAVE